VTLVLSNVITIG